MEFKRINQIQFPDKRFYEIFLPTLFIIIGLFGALIMLFGEMKCKDGWWLGKVIT